MRCRFQHTLVFLAFEDDHDFKKMLFITLLVASVCSCCCYRASCRVFVRCWSTDTGKTAHYYTTSNLLFYFQLITLTWLMISTWISWCMLSVLLLLLHTFLSGSSAGDAWGVGALHRGWSGHVQNVPQQDTRTGKHMCACAAMTYCIWWAAAVCGSDVR